MNIVVVTLKVVEYKHWPVRALGWYVVNRYQAAVVRLTWVVRLALVAIALIASVNVFFIDNHRLVNVKTLVTFAPLLALF